uniref:Uncharacterized protein n=1 Tax=Physcomitrium patens TaxID=3218 RepID=A0A2K1KEP4_PHYPA|nr:hypothetical protein PHYPA_008625 [Physcomitrium patens]
MDITKSVIGRCQRGYRRKRSEKNETERKFAAGPFRRLRHRLPVFLVQSIVDLESRVRVPKFLCN